MVNFYELLGVNQKASEDEIRTKLKAKKRIWTQRQNAPKLEQQQEASNHLRMVPEIEATLLDAQKRIKYDEQLLSSPKEKSHVDTSKIEADDLINEGWRLLSVGNIPDALMVATKATEVQGNNPDAWALLGYTKAQWGEVEDAIYEYKRAIKLRPNDASFYFDLGGIYEGIEQWKDAMQQYERSVQIDSGITVYRAAMGGVFIKNEMYEEGIDILEKCNQEEPDNDDYKYFLAIAYVESGYQKWTFVPAGHEISSGYYATTMVQVEQASTLVDKAAKICPNDSDIEARIKEVRRNIESMKKRTFHGSMLVVIVGLAYFGLGILYYFSCLVPQYKLNKRIIKSGAETGTQQMIAEMGQDGLSGAAFGVGISLAFLPIIIPINFIKNYVGK